MIAHLRANLILLILTMAICSVLYPLALWAVGQTLFRAQAQGSLTNGPDGNPVGSRLIAQPFSGDSYFQPRPSAASYNAAASGASNWGANNPKLRFRVTRQLGPMVRYSDAAAYGERRGQLVGPDIEKWFAEKDRLAAWATDNPTLAAEWVKTDDDAKRVVGDWVKANPDVVAAWQKANTSAIEVPDPEKTPDAYAVPFFTTFAAKHPRAFPGLTEYAGDNGKTVKRLQPTTTGSDLQGVFFDSWLQEHPTVELEKVPADMVMASGSGLDAHITLANARWQSRRVVAARVGQIIESQKQSGLAEHHNRLHERIADEVEKLLQEQAIAPMAGLIGAEPLLNVLELNLTLDARLKQLAER